MYMDKIHRLLTAPTRHTKKNVCVERMQERERLDEAVLKKAKRRELRKNRSVGLLLPSQSKTNLSSSFGNNASPSVRFSEPEPEPEPEPATMADCGASCGGVNGGATSSSGGNTNFDENGLRNRDELCSNNNNSAETAITNSSDEAQSRLARDEHHLLQRRRHHHNFKKSASSRNLAGTDGMDEPDSSSLLLSQREEHDGGGGAPVSVTTSVDVYSGGSVRSSSLSGRAAVNVPAELPLDDACGSRSGGGRRSSRGKSVSFEPGISNSNTATGSPCSRNAKQRISSSSSARLSSDGGDVRGDGEMSRGGNGSEHLSSTLNGDCSTTTVSTTATTAAAAAVAVEATAEDEKVSATATTQPSVGGTRYPTDVGDGVSAGGKGGATESLGTTTAGDWYGHSKLSAAASGLARASAAGGDSGAHDRAPAAGAANPRVHRPRPEEWLAVRSATRAGQF